ncbi:MAG: PriCT-2 domain-containing protein [Ruminococcus sp.]|nr:PriCT-2 domain-containing protein [Ruminococcus sp.]
MNTAQKIENVLAPDEALRKYTAQAQHCIPSPEFLARTQKPAQTEKTFNIGLDTVCFKDKPKGSQVGRIKSRLAKGVKPITLRDFIKAVKSGCTFVPAEVDGEQVSENWKSQQIFCVDIDNKTDPKSPDYMLPEKALDICSTNNIKPFFLYHTFSSTKEVQKYRICFVLDRLITDTSEREKIITTLIELFKPVSDPACKDPARLFFAGKNDCSAFEDLQAVTSADTVLEIHKKQHALPAPILSASFKTDYTNKTVNSDWAKEFEADPNILLNCIDAASIDYDEWLNVSASYKVAYNGSFDLWRDWNIKADKWKEKPDTKTWKSLNGKDITEGTLKFFAQQTAQGKQYMDSLRYGMEQAKKGYRKSHDVKLKEQVSDNTEYTNTIPSYILQTVNQRTGEVKYNVSCPLLADYIRKNSHYIFVKNEAFDSVRRYWYSDGCYRLITDEELKGYIKSYITDFDITLLKMRDVKEVFDDLITDRNFVGEDGLNSDENIINFQNGLLYLDTMELKQHTPDILSTIQIPCNWNPNAEDSPVFDSFINTFTDGNEDKRNFLLQYIGACLSNIKGYRMKKALFMVGAGDTGKTQLKSLTERLLGECNTSPADLSDLEKRFGTSKIYGKRLVGSTDMSYATVSELKLFKQITGGDEISIEKKGRDAFNYKYNGFLWFCTNELPKFGGDRGKWVYERIIPFRCSHVIPKDKQDKLLCDKMFAEREAIVYRCVMAVNKVIENGYRFDIPTECMKELEEYKKDNSPCIQFFDECCIMRPDGKIRDNCTTRKVHDVLKEWCRDNTGGYTPKTSVFKKEIAQYINVDERTLIKIIHGTYYYIFTLSADAKEAYHIYDSLQEN